MSTANPANRSWCRAKQARDEGRRKQETRQRYPVGEVNSETHLSKA